MAEHCAPPLQLLKEFARHISDIFIPPICISCSQLVDRHHGLCAKCWREISFVAGPVCDRLGIPLSFDPGDAVVMSAAALAKPPAYDRARAATHFSGTVRDLMHRFKYGDQHTARRLFAQWLLFAAQEIITECDIIIPVPLHRQRLRMRRFNQSAILAQDLSTKTGLEFRPDILVRQRSTLPQVGLTRDQRRRNLQGAFSVPDEEGRELFGRSVLLVDDVITTGTTIDICARVLKQAGASQVNIVAVSMVTAHSRIDL